MFWLSYKCFSISFDALLLKSAISSHNSCVQHKLLILIVSSNIFHWKSVKKSKVGVVFGAKFRPNLVQCQKNKEKLVF